MTFSKMSLAFTACAITLACSSGPTEEEIAVRVDDFRQRSAQYFNTGSYQQAFQQAHLGLEIATEEDGELNLLAGHALMMMRNRDDVASSQKYLELASELLESYRADLILGEFHQRYGSMLHAHALRQRKSIASFPNSNEEQRADETAENDKRFATAQDHFQQATELFLVALSQSPNDLHALQLIGQSYALLRQSANSRQHLNHALEILLESRQYKNRVLATDARMDLKQETRLRGELLSDIEAEVAIRMLVAGLDNIDRDIDAELAQYSHILGLSPQSLNAVYGRAMCYYKLGNFALATKDLEYFISNTALSFEHPQVRRAFEIIGETTN
ncbi:MAG: tetratricopeptide (TPR) repeat protein [Myxococcota bacterium]|jgi:tetratricopeptide (TPR) repeat protein